MQTFVINSEALDKRLDCYYYQPHFLELEEKVKKLSKNTLKDYVVGIAGGATPDKNNPEKYYTNGESGVPFVRVQNLSPQGLSLDDCVYINQETHVGMLKRSQVKPGDLLVKITGVGRMAISSVAPDGFEGNINQHIVVLKTKSRDISEALAAYLNSDIGEKLASRRATGGTRPALDYQALLSIPVVVNSQITSYLKEVYKKNKEKEQNVNLLLSEINGYILNKLGISIDTSDNSTTYTVFSDEIEGRIDAYYYKPTFRQLYKTLKQHEAVPFSNIIQSITNGLDYRDFTEDGQTPYLRVSNIKPDDIDYETALRVGLDIDGVGKDIHGKSGDILLTRKGTFGVSAVIDTDLTGIISSEIFLIRIDKTKVNPQYLSIYLNSQLGQLQFDSKKVGAIMGSLSQEAVGQVLIIVPSKETQDEIVKEVNRRKKEAKTLMNEVDASLSEAKAKIEEMILGA